MWVLQLEPPKREVIANLFSVCRLIAQLLRVQDEMRCDGLG